MSRVLLLNPMYRLDYTHTSRCDKIILTRTIWYPIHLAYCCGYLEKHGHECMLVDAEADGLDVKQQVKVAEEFKPEYTVMYVSERVIDYFGMIAKEIKEKTGSRIIFVGATTLPDPETKLRHCDSVVPGEFDRGVLELVEGLTEDKVVVRDPVELSEFPFVTDVYRRHLNLRNYRVSFLKHPYIDLFTSRRCYWGKCTFCLWQHTLYKNSAYRERDLDDVIREFKFIQKEIPEVREIFLQDDAITSKRIRELSSRILDEGLKIRWSCYVRPDVDLDVLPPLYESGCRVLDVGFESGNNKVLEAMNKGVTRNRMEEFARTAYKLGFSVHGDFQVGSCELDGRESILETVRWAKSLPLSSYQFFTPEPYRGTPYRRYLEEKGFLEDGYPNYPKLTYKDMEDLCRRGIRECHLNIRYFMRMLKHPGEWPRLLSEAKVLPKFFLGDWKVR